MQLENYKLYLLKTVNSCPDKVKRFLVKRFLEEGIATNESDSNQLVLEGLGCLNISGKSLSDKLLICLQKSDKAIRIYEKWEFEKDYKYSVIFTCDVFDELIKKIYSIEVLKDSCENENISNSFSLPIAYHTEEYSFLKFNLTFAAVHPLSGEELLLKYPFLVVFHKEGKLIEFRFDVIKRLYILGNKETTIYSDLINEMVKYFRDNFNCSLTPFNLEFMVNSSKNDKDVKLIAQYMKLPSGGNAQLEVGNNQEYVLPFIGELKTLLLDYKNELEEIPAVKEALEQFMYEMEEMSDYPWIELLWENEIKTRSIHVKFIFNYMSNHYCLIQHYYSNYLLGMERMNHVIKYIINHRNDITGEISQ